MASLTPASSHQQGPQVSGIISLPTYNMATSSTPEGSMRSAGAPSHRLAADMAEIGRHMGRVKRTRRRLVLKSGECNVWNRNVTKRHRSYLIDIFTTLIDMKWRFHLIFFTSGFLVSWCFFALIWLIIAYAHGDMILSEDLNSTACVEGVFDYHTALLFSIETQHTIGYGTRAVSDECWYAVGVLMFQSCLGAFVQALITGLIFAKISRPKGRSQTMLFSEKAVICKRDYEYYLLFRVGDMRRSHIIGTSIRAMLVKNRLTAEGELIPLCQYPLTLESETSRSDCFAFLVWPVTVVHKIDSSSPLWEVSATSLYQESFEIIVILEGTIESTGSLTQVRTSYIPSEIRWGERLAPLLTYQRQNGRYEIDFEQFHGTLPMTNMQTCSARENHEVLSLSEDSGRPLAQEKDYPASFTAPAVRSCSAPSLRKYALSSLFHRKSKQPVQQLEQQQLATFDGIRRRNNPGATLQLGAGSEASITSAVSNPGSPYRKPGSKRPLWSDKQQHRRSPGGVGSPGTRRMYVSTGRLIEENLPPGLTRELSNVSIPQGVPQGDNDMLTHPDYTVSTEELRSLTSSPERISNQLLSDSIDDALDELGAGNTIELSVIDDQVTVNHNRPLSQDSEVAHDNANIEYDDTDNNLNRNYKNNEMIAVCIGQDDEVGQNNDSERHVSVSRNNSRFKVTTAPESAPQSPSSPNPDSDWSGGGEMIGDNCDNFVRQPSSTEVASSNGIRNSRSFPDCTADYSSL